MVQLHAIIEKEGRGRLVHEAKIALAPNTKLDLHLALTQSLNYSDSSTKMLSTVHNWKQSSNKGTIGLDPYLTEDNLPVTVFNQT